MSEMSESFVQFKNVQKSYDGEIVVVKDFNLDIAKGEFLTMLVHPAPVRPHVS
jgi:putative spermidine/putrescine transport system ATP-binding protein